MLNSYIDLQSGLMSPKSFKASITAHRLIELELSNHRNIELFHKGGIKAMDIEKIDSQYLLSGGANGGLCIHDLTEKSSTTSYAYKAICKIKGNSRYAHKYSVDTVQWYPFDTGIFTTSGMDCQLKIWDTNNLKPIDIFNFADMIYCHNMSSKLTQHNLIAVALDSPHIIIVDPKSGSRCHQLRSHKSKVICVKWSPLHEYLIASGGADSKIFLWDIRRANSCLTTLDQHNGEAKGNHKNLVTAHNGLVNSLQFTKDGLYLVSYGTDSRLRLWNMDTGKNTLVNYGRVFNDNPRQCIIDICYESSIPMVFAPTQSYVNMYDLFTGLKIKTLSGHLSSVNCCIFRPTMHEIYSGGNDRMMLLWTPDVKRELVDEKNKETADDLSDEWSSDND